MSLYKETLTRHSEFIKDTKYGFLFSMDKSQVLVTVHDFLARSNP